MDLLGLGVERIDLLLGNVPRLEIVQGPVDLVAVALHGTKRTEHEDLRNRFHVFLGLVEDLLVELELNQSL